MICPTCQTPTVAEHTSTGQRRDPGVLVAYCERCNTVYRPRLEAVPTDRDRRDLA